MSGPVEAESSIGLFFRGITMPLVNEGPFDTQDDRHTCFIRMYKVYKPGAPASLRPNLVVFDFAVLNAIGGTFDMTFPVISVGEGEAAVAVGGTATINFNSTAWDVVGRMKGLYPIASPVNATAEPAPGWRDDHTPVGQGLVAMLGRVYTLGYFGTAFVGYAPIIRTGYYRAAIGTFVSPDSFVAQFPTFQIDNLIGPDPGSRSLRTTFFGARYPGRR